MNRPMTKLPLNILTLTLTMIGRDKKAISVNILNISPTFQLNIFGYLKNSDPFSSRERRKTDCLWIGVVPVKQTFSVNSTIFIDELESKFGIFLLKFLIYKPFTYDRTGRILFYPNLVVEEVSNYKFL